MFTMKIITAIDSFKGSLSSAEANSAAARAIARVIPQCDVREIAVSDGGEGWLEACARTFGGRMEQVTVSDPLGRPIRAAYLQSGDMAVVEVAQACGLTLLAPHERNPLVADTRGVGQLLLHAMKSGCRRIVVGLGGSATCDAGLGMLQVLADEFAPFGGMTALSDLHGVDFVIASDVQNPLLGTMGAAKVFAPQKGATRQMVEELEERACRFVALSGSAMGFDRSQEAGAGAAGGLGYAFLQYLNATYVSGAEWLMESARFKEELQTASLVVTGEGSADAHTLMGKLPFRLMKNACLHQVPTVLLAGRVSELEALLAAGFHDVLCINPPEETSSGQHCLSRASLRLETTLCEYLSQSFCRKYHR